MRVLGVLAAALLAGCAMSPQQMAQRSDFDVCRLSTTPAQGQVAFEEARLRKLDCRPYYPAIQAQQANQAAAYQNYMRYIQQQQQPMQRPLICNSDRMGNTVQTTCN